MFLTLHVLNDDNSSKIRPYQLQNMTHIYVTLLVLNNCILSTAKF